MLQKQEIVHNSDEQVIAYLRDALNAVENLDPPNELREAVFNKAVELYSSKTVTVEQIMPGGILSPNAGH